MTAPPLRSDVDFLCNGNCVIDLDTEVSHGAFHLGVAKQELDRTQIARAPVNQRGLRSSQRVRAEE